MEIIDTVKLGKNNSIFLDDKIREQLGLDENNKLIGIYKDDKGQIVLKSLKVK